MVPVFISIKYRYRDIFKNALLDYMLCVCCPCFVSRPNPWFLCQVSVIIRQCLRVTLQMIWFLLQFSLMGLYPWAPSRLSVGGRGEERAKLGGGVDSNEWVRVGVRDAILAPDFRFRVYTPPIPSIYFVN